MDIIEAFQIVLDLAKQNIIDEHEDADEYERQINAINIIEDLAGLRHGDE